MTKIKLFDPSINKLEEKSIVNVLKSHFWASGAGTNYVQKFEKQFQKFVNSDNTVAVNSGTAALHLALSLFNLSNKEVILPSLSFVSTAHAVILNQAKPVFVDVDPSTLCIDPEKIKSLISKKTEAILPVHFGGFPCNLDAISKICIDNNIPLVEDAAHAAGASYKNNKIGTHGKFVCFSFHPVKNLSMPSGGLISINGTNHKNFKKILNSRRWCGITNRIGSEYDVKELGWNYYMNEFSAVLGLVQLDKLDKMNKKRKLIAKKYFTKINLEEKMPFNTECSYHLYWILVKNRTKFRKNLHDVGIETGIHYKPIHLMSMYKNNRKLPITEKISKQIVSIPIHPNLTNSQTNKIINAINKYS
ncbi:MAG: DegT/DnrJ/EryC1/StrS family aminotransferase [Nitrosopumilus sp.]|nr:DegT/DnrJ/EryC1/StrS family aminotransferase [Nitrosopumilus sp.]